MGSRAPRTVALAAAVFLWAVALLVAFPAAAEPPTGGAFTPGESLAGVRVGMTQDEVLAAWGQRHGVCRECRQTTWYFNERPFQPQGMGVVFAGGRAVHAFTVWQPAGWATPEGLALGDPAGAIGATYGELAEQDCGDYLALVGGEEGARSVFYVHEDDVWGFGLIAPDRSPCP
ncbi:MAG TPA: hypothetical protein VG479_06340 [Gaiellaceae bacterium]|nr:hypothetical protein [Gaiellaceae bacterium]